MRRRGFGRGEARASHRRGAGLFQGRIGRRLRRTRFSLCGGVARATATVRAFCLGEAILPSGVSRCIARGKSPTDSEAICLARAQRAKVRR